MALQRLLHEAKRCILVAGPGDVALKDLALLIYRSPQVNHFTVELHVHLIEMPPPVTEPPHSADPLTADIACEHWPEPVPPMPHRLVTDVDPTLKQQSSTLRSDRGKRTYIITTNRITSGDELKYRNGLAGLLGRGIHLTHSAPIINRCIWSDRAGSRHEKGRELSPTRGPMNIPSNYDFALGFRPRPIFLAIARRCSE